MQLKYPDSLHPRHAATDLGGITFDFAVLTSSFAFAFFVTFNPPLHLDQQFYPPRQYHIVVRPITTASPVGFALPIAANLSLWQNCASFLVPSALLLCSSATPPNFYQISDSTPPISEPQVTMTRSNPIFPPRKDGNQSILNSDNFTSSDGMIDSAKASEATVRPIATDNDNGGPSDSPRSAGASTVQHSVVRVASLDIPTGSLRDGDRALADIQRDNQRPTQSRMAIGFILNSDLPRRNGFSEASVTDNNSTANVHRGGSTTGTGEKTTTGAQSTAHFANTICTVHGSCRRDMSGCPMETLNKLLSQSRKGIDMMDKLTQKVAASGSCIISADQCMKPPIENINKLSEKNNIIWQTMRSEAQRTRETFTHFVQLQKNVADDEESKAEKKPLRFIADGTKSTVYEIPESFGGLILKVGPWAAINQERLNILRLEQAYQKVNHLIWNGSKPSWLKPLLFPVVRDVVPTGWARSAFDGLVRHCKNLNPRIPEFYDADDDRMSVNYQDHVGIVLSRIGDLEDCDRRKVLQRCYGLEDPQLEAVLHDNDHCLIRIYLGRISDDAQWDDIEDSIEDSIEDVIMGDAENYASITSSDDTYLSTLNLPGYLDHIIKACRARPPLESFAREIAFGYAMLHWGAGLDGRGIEFLLGLSPTGVGRRLYMLDFEDCCPIGELTARCVRDQLVPAALGNGPYIPRATSSGSSDEFVWKTKDGVRYKVFTRRSHEVFVWEVFKKHYLEASWKIWEARDRDFDPSLPEVFITELKKGFFKQNVERNADGVSDHNVASEDETHDQPGQCDITGAEVDPEHHGADEDNRS